MLSTNIMIPENPTNNTNNRKDNRKGRSKTQRITVQKDTENVEGEWMLQSAAAQF